MSRDDLTDSLDFDTVPFRTPPALAAPLNHEPRDKTGLPGPICKGLSPEP